MFETVFNEITWDIHGSAPFSPIECYKRPGRPDVRQRLHLAARGPRRARAARATRWSWRSASSAARRRSTPPAAATTHPGCWTVLFAGGPIKGGQVVGASDEIGYAPKDRPVTTAEIAATVYQGLGIDLDTELPGPQGRPLRSSTTASSRSASCSDRTIARRRTRSCRPLPCVPDPDADRPGLPQPPTRDPAEVPPHARIAPRIARSSPC